VVGSGILTQTEAGSWPQAEGNGCPFVRQLSEAKLTPFAQSEFFAFWPGVVDASPFGRTLRPTIVEIARNDSRVIDLCNRSIARGMK